METFLVLQNIPVEWEDKVKSILVREAHSRIDRRIDGLSAHVIPNSRWINSNNAHTHREMSSNYSFGENNYGSRQARNASYENERFTM